jgi:hypothetical protein
MDLRRENGTDEAYDGQPKTKHKRVFRATDLVSFFMGIRNLNYHLRKQAERSRLDETETKKIDFKERGA